MAELVASRPSASAVAATRPARALPAARLAPHQDGAAAAAVLEEEPVAVAARAAGGPGHPQAPAAPLEAAPDPHQDPAPRLLGHGEAPAPADREGGRHGHQRPARLEEVPHVLAVVFPRDHQQRRQPRRQAVGAKAPLHARGREGGLLCGDGGAGAAERGGSILAWKTCWRHEERRLGDALQFLNFCFSAPLTSRVGASAISVFPQSG